MSKNPIYTAFQFDPAKRQEGPIPFMSNIGGPMGNLQAELDWRLNDFCMIHQIVYKHINKVDEALDKIQVQPPSTDLDDGENLYRSRIMDQIIAQDNINKQVNSFVDQITVVGLWAIAEQFLGKIFRAYSSIKNGIAEIDIKTPYKWNDFVTEYGKLSMDLSTCENFINADECRVLNNTIKHNPIVQGTLLNYPYFLPFEDQKLDNVTLEMQRYLNGVSDFLGSLIEKINEELE